MNKGEEGEKYTRGPEISVLALEVARKIWSSWEWTLDFWDALERSSYHTRPISSSIQISFVVIYL